MKINNLVNIIVSSLVILFIFSGCSSKPSLDLESVTVDIRNDEYRLGGQVITSGDREGELIVPTALSYDIVLKNTGETPLGGMNEPNIETFEYDDGIIVKIKPNERLKELLEEIMDFNIYHEDKNNFGIGTTSFPLLEAKQEGKYTFDYYLGALEENPVMEQAPSIEQLGKLQENAMDATLIVYVEDEEIARFDLNDFE